MLKQIKTATIILVLYCGLWLGYNRIHIISEGLNVAKTVKFFLR